MSIKKTEITDAPGLTLRNLIEELRQRYENDYKKSHTDIFNKLTSTFFEELVILHNHFLIVEDAVERYRTIKKEYTLVESFIETYQEVYDPEFGKALGSIRELFKCYSIFVEGLGLITLAGAETSNLVKYKQYTEGFNLLAEVVNTCWHSFDREIQEVLLEITHLLQEKTGLRKSSTRWSELKDEWKKLRLALKLFWPSIKTGIEDGTSLLTEYKKAVNLFITSVTTKIAEENQILKTSTLPKFSSVESILEYVKSSPSWQGDDFEESLDYINDIRS